MAAKLRTSLVSAYNDSAIYSCIPFSQIKQDHNNTLSTNKRKNMKLINQLIPIAAVALSSVCLATGQAPSAAPSTSSAPTFTIDVDRFDWDIERNGPAEIAFSDETDTEIKLRYNISIRDTVVRAFEIDCFTPVPNTVAAVKSKRSIKSPKYADLEVAIDFAQVRHYFLYHST
jgi:hypothetical protein